MTQSLQVIVVIDATFGLHAVYASILNSYLLPLVSTLQASSTRYAAIDYQLIKYRERAPMGDFLVRVTKSTRDHAQFVQSLRDVTFGGCSGGGADGGVARSALADALCAAHVVASARASDVRHVVLVTDCAPSLRPCNGSCVLGGNSVAHAERLGKLVKFSLIAPRRLVELEQVRLSSCAVI